MHVIPVGIDTETCRGKPFSFQYYSEELKLERIDWPNSKSATPVFCRFLDSLPDTRDRHYILFGHNLSFDFVSLFYDRHRLLRDEVIESKWFGWTVHIVYAAVRFAEFRKGHKHVTIVDTAAYFARSLAVLAELVCPDLPKLEAPKGLGKKIFKKSDKKFCAYAMRDSVIAYLVGKRILKMHEEMDVSVSVSAPHFASKVFRKAFLKIPIPLPPRKIVYSAMSAYHGGKNNVTIGAGFYRRVYSLDIRSAYPHAMHSLPSLSNAKLYRAITGRGHPETTLPPFGIYRISGYAKDCPWPILYDHSFKPLRGAFNRIWVTGFELNEALIKREVRLTETYGYFYDAILDKEKSPFRAYVAEFFRRKDTATDKIEREFWKLLLNSLYGKFIQTRGGTAFSDIVYDIDEKKIISEANIIAGGLFNPFIASLITGHTRARIHQLEHRYKALHTSTDGIFTQIKPKQIPGLGGLSIEASGDLLLFRNKLYIFYGDLSRDDISEIEAAKRDNRACKIKLSTIFRDKRYKKYGRKIIKFALHGFHGDLPTLERLYSTGTREYEYTKVNKLRESIRHRLQVNDFVQREASLKLEHEFVKSEVQSNLGGSTQWLRENPKT